LGALDLGLSFAVLREIAADSAGRDSRQTQALVASAGNVYLLLGVAGALLIAFGGAALGERLDLSSRASIHATSVFGFHGVAFLADRLFAFHTAVLQGSRRFGSLNLLRGSWVLARAVGLVVLLELGMDVSSLAAWHALSAWLLLGGAFAAVRVQDPRYRFRFGALDWEPVREHIRLSLSWQLSTWLGSLLLQIAPVLIGVIAGSAAVVPFYVGYKIPQLVSSIGWHSAEVLVPPSSLEHRRGDRAALRGILRAGTRWITMLVLPLGVILWILAPRLLAAWIGDVDARALLVLRVTMPAAVLDAVGAAAVAVLWGQGAARQMLKVISLALVVHVFISLWLIPRLGPVGAGWSMLVAIGFGTAGYLLFSARAVHRSALQLVRASFAGLLLPGLCATLITAGVAYVSTPLDPWGIGLTGVVGLAVFGVGLRFERQSGDHFV
ncbi:MAG: polysaccharide biosynthesis C-terminal domain-containing protein, partial [Thermoanaerobaculia bacterium]